MRPFICAAILLLTACDRGVVGDPTVFGDYSLRTVNGNSLPATVGNTQYLDDVISLAEALTYQESGHVKNVSTGTTQNITEVGSYEFLFGTNVTLNSSDGLRVRLAKVKDSNEMTIVEEGVTLVYRK
jgi:hypothetical protein